MEYFNNVVINRERFLQAIEELNICAPMYIEERNNYSDSNIYHISKNEKTNQLRKVFEIMFNKMSNDKPINTQITMDENGCLNIICNDGEHSRYFHIIKLSCKGETASCVADKKYEEYAPKDWWFVMFHDYNFKGYKKIFKRFLKENTI